MRVSLKIAFFIAAVTVVVMIWAYSPAEKPPEAIWTLGFKLRLSGSALIGLLLFYIFFDRVVFAARNKKGKG